MSNTSAITEPLAGVTMIDVTEGDCYIVDLLDSKNPNQDAPDRKKWKRFLIDTGSVNDEIKRRQTIINALTNITNIDPWLKKEWPGAPPLAGVVVTHSDRDHSGNAHKLLNELSREAKMSLPLIDFVAAHGTGKVPVYLTPTVQWTRELRPEGIGKNQSKGDYETKAAVFYRNKACEFFEVVLLDMVEKVEVRLVDQITTPDRCFPNLEKLAKIGAYTIKYRFHFLKLDPLHVAIKAINSQMDNKALVNIEQYCSYFQKDWQSSNFRSISDIKTKIREHQLVVEVGLFPNEIKRTFSEINAELVTGPWLRIITEIPPPNSKGIRTEVPHSNFFESQLINLENRYNQISPDGVWSTSVMGCADKGYVRDFQHLVLQSLAPKNKDKIVVSDPLSLWSQYANRASIINFFSHDSDLSREGKISAPYKNAGGFKMLFTGDAFELNEGMEKMTGLNEARRQTADNKSLTDFGISPGTQIISSEGNLMNWLSGDQKENQKIHVDVLKVPHHGSQVTTDPAFFYNVSASVYLISGSSMTHGHPTVQVLEAIVKSVWEKKTEAASAPSWYRSEKTQKSILLSDINQRERPRLVFCSYACEESSKKREQTLSEIIAKLCHRGERLVNIKFLVQKEKNSFSRIIFGRDARHLLRVEWDVNSWKELRPDKLNKSDWNTAKDPLAYPLPGANPGW